MACSTARQPGKVCTSTAAPSTADRVTTNRIATFAAWRSTARSFLPSTWHLRSGRAACGSGRQSTTICTFPARLIRGARRFLPTASASPWPLTAHRDPSLACTNSATALGRRRLDRTSRRSVRCTCPPPVTASSSARRIVSWCARGTATSRPSVWLSSGVSTTRRRVNVIPPLARTHATPSLVIPTRTLT